MANILIFEDNVELAHYWREFLEADNHSVWCCMSVDEAFETANEIAPDIVIMDMLIQHDGELIPEGGLTLLSKLRLKYAGSPYVIGVSGYRPGKYSKVTPLEIAKETGSGIDLALYKPITPEQLINAVNQLLTNNDFNR